MLGRRVNPFAYNSDWHLLSSHSFTAELSIKGPGKKGNAPPPHTFDGSLNFLCQYYRKHVVNCKENMHTNLRV